QAEDGIRDFHVTGVQTCALPICPERQKIDVASLRCLWFLGSERRQLCRTPTDAADGSSPDAGPLRSGRSVCLSSPFDDAEADPEDRKSVVEGKSGDARSGGRLQQ